MKLHPADQCLPDIIKRAEFFVVSFFVGRGQYNKHKVRTFQDARNFEAAMRRLDGRKGMIYAIEGKRQTFIPEHFVPDEA